MVAAIAAGGTQPAADSRQPAAYTGAELWLHRLAVLSFVFVCATVGVLLVIRPWDETWAANHLLAGHPAMQVLIASPFVRGVCSGLGLLNIWIGFWEAVHYTEEKKG